MEVWVLIDRKVFSGVYTSAESAMQWFQKNKAWTKVTFTWFQEGDYAWRIDPANKMGEVNIIRCPVFEPPVQ